jgi:conjugative transfer signal peptidase TraF
MEVRRRLIPLPIDWLILCLSGVVFSFWAFDLTLNLTPSMPVGVWRVSKSVVIEESLRHKAVLFCPSDTDVFRWPRSQHILSLGRCPGDFTPLLKEVVGLPGDLIEVSDGSVILNGQPLPLSIILPSGWPAPEATHEIPAGSIWVMGSSSAESFDSRYFGPIGLEKTIGKAEPILTLR